MSNCGVSRNQVASSTRPHSDAFGERFPVRLVQGVSLLAAICLLVTGCGRDSGEATVPPPSAREQDAPPTESVDPDKPVDRPLGSVDRGETLVPGGFELPQGEIPPASGPDRPKEPSGGFEMPKDVDLPNLTPGTPREDTGGADPESAGLPSSGASAPLVEYASWEEIESAARSASGRVTVLDLWSLACEPCLKEFPGLVQLHQVMGEKVRCMAVNLDFDGRASRPPESYEEQVLAFLHGVGATGFPSYISRTASDEIFAATKLASIPAVLVFHPDGAVAKVFVDAGETVGFSYEKDIVPYVRQLID